jgi:hypothetical protein
MSGNTVIQSLPHLQIKRRYFVIMASSRQRPACDSRCPLGPRHKGRSRVALPRIICAVARRVLAASIECTLSTASAGGKPDQAAQGATGVGSHVVSQRDRQSGAARAPHRYDTRNQIQGVAHYSNAHVLTRRYGRRSIDTFREESFGDIYENPELQC